MHPAVLNATGYTLLLSSFVTFVILLREGCKYKKNSPFYILSTSDVLSTILTAIVLLMSHIGAGIKLNYNWQDNNYTWAIEDGAQLPFPQIRDLRETADEIEHESNNITLTCDMKDIFMQHGMLLAPLTNAFMSLLTLAAQCNLNAACLKRRCANMTKSLISESKNAEATYRQEGTLKDEHESTLQQSNDIDMKSKIGVILRMKLSKFYTLKENNKKLASFLVMSHWLVPFFAVAILYLAEYNDINVVRYTEDTECIVESNFPMTDFYMYSNIEDNLNIVNSSTHTTPLDYFINNLSNTNNTEVDQIISKIQNIVRTALNHMHDSENAESTNLQASSELQNTIQVVNNESHIQNDANIDSVIGRINDTITEQNDTLEEELDIIASNNVSNVTQMSVREKDDDEEDSRIHFVYMEENITQGTTSVPIVQQHTAFISNNQIYADIMKRIQAVSSHTAVKGHYNRSVNRYYDRKQLRGDNLRNYITKPYLTKYLSFGKNSFNHDITETKAISQYMINKCLISTEFLKLYLFVLLFATYFLPILLCCILQVKGTYSCKNALAILKVKADLVSSVHCDDLDSNESNDIVIVTSDKKTCLQDSIKALNMPQGIKYGHSSTTNMKTTSKYRENMDVQNTDVHLQIDYLSKLFRTIKMSLILCIVLWTPIFLGTLLKIFSCIHTPQWLTDITFVSALSFGVIRNILNINIMKIQKFCNDTDAKENKIHPIE